jgi:homoserine dehydrogenase
MTNIAILGNGTVGSGVIELIKKNSDKLKERTGEEIKISKVLVRNIEKHSHSENFELITDSIEDIFTKSLDIVVEVIGGIHPAYEYIKMALEMKKHVVTANKDLISKYGEELLDLANKNNVKLYFEASVGGGIPILKPLSECLVGNEIKSLKGILNGTTNFILSKMHEDGMKYGDALKLAQELGFAEANPESDVMGYDAARKLSILSTISYNQKVGWEDIKTIGIKEIDEVDIKSAKEANCNIKLLALSKSEEDGIYATVRPVMVSTGSQISNVENEFNGILVDGDAVGEVFFYGKGAGKLPTASAVFGDIIDIIENKGKKTFKPARKKAIVKDKWMYKSDWMLRIKSSDRLKLMCDLSESFKSCYFLNEKGNNQDEVVAFVQSENEVALDFSIKKLHDINKITSIKKMMKLESA